MVAHGRLYATPILGWAAVMAAAMGLAPAIAPALAPMRQSLLYAHRGLNVPLLADFYGLKWLDLVFGELVTAFGMLQFHSDSRFYWGTLDFLTQYGSVYAFLLLEASRPSRSKRMLFSVVFLSLVGQLIPAGIANPVFFYLLEKNAPIRSPGTAERRESPDPVVTLAVIPAVALAYLVPHLSGFIDPDLETRHWWNWIWQLFGVWGALLLLIFWFTIGRLLRITLRIKLVTSPLKALRLAAVLFCLINTGTYWYVHASSGFSWWDIVVPRQLLPPAPSAEEALGTVLQYDSICTFGGAFTWLAYQLAGLKASGALKTSLSYCLSIGAVVGVVFGPGTLWVVGWMVKEEILQADAAKSSDTKKD